MNSKGQNEEHFGRTEFGGLLFIILIVSYIWLVFPQLNFSEGDLQSKYIFIGIHLILISIGFTFSFFIKILKQIFKEN